MVEISALNLSQKSESTALFQWAYSSTGGLLYQIAYQQGSLAPSDCKSGTVISSSTIGDQTSWNIAGLSENTTYSFRFCAVNSYDTSRMTKGITSTITTYVYCDAPIRNLALSEGNNGSGTSASDPYYLCNLNQLDEVRQKLDGFYKLKGNIDASATQLPSWDGTSGFNPIGDATNPFTGSFGGNNYSINDLYINRAQSYVALFGKMDGAIVENLRLTNFDINEGVSYVGTLFGRAENSTFNNINVEGSILTTSFNEYFGLVGGFSSNSSFDQVVVSGSVETNDGLYLGLVIGILLGSSLSNCQISGRLVGYENIGGLVGVLSLGSQISDCTVDADITANFRYIGGAVGQALASTITNIKGKGSITTSVGRIGGLVGALFSNSTLSNSNFKGRVNAGSGAENGGLVGVSDSSTVEKSFAHAYLDGGSRDCGGLIGNAAGSVVTESFATGRVENCTDIAVGGLVGYLAFGSEVTNSWASASSHTTYNGGSVVGIGGLIGYNLNSTVQFTYATGTANAPNRPGAGGLLGTLWTQSGGTARVIDSFATGQPLATGLRGGLVGYQNSEAGSIENSISASSFWDIDLSNRSVMCGTSAGTGPRTGCNDGNGITGNTAYWVNASNPPMNSWSFTGGSPFWIELSDTYPMLSYQKTLRAFATSTRHNGNLGGIIGANNICQNTAAGASLGGNWKAILSTSSDEIFMNLDVIGPLYKTNGTLLSHAGYNSISPLNYDENGVQILADFLVWTGTAADGGNAGNTLNNCSDWTSELAIVSGAEGSTNSVANLLYNSTDSTCDNLRRLYCIEQ